MSLPRNHGRPWTEADDERLWIGHQDEEPIERLADLLERTPYSIQCRLEYLKARRGSKSALTVDDTIKKSFLVTIVADPVTYLKGHDIRSYSDEQLFKLLEQLTEQRDRCLKLPTQLAADKALEYQEQLTQLVNAMDALHERRQVEEEEAR